MARKSGTRKLYMGQMTPSARDGSHPSCVAKQILMDDNYCRAYQKLWYNLSIGMVNKPMDYVTPKQNSLNSVIKRVKKAVFTWL